MQHKVLLCLLSFMPLVHAQKDFSIWQLPCDVQKIVLKMLPIKKLHCPQLWTIIACLDKAYPELFTADSKLLWKISLEMGYRRDATHRARSLNRAFIVLNHLRDDHKETLRAIMARTTLMNENLISAEPIPFHVKQGKRGQTIVLSSDKKFVADPSNSSHEKYEQLRKLALQHHFSSRDGVVCYHNRAISNFRDEDGFIFDCCVKTVQKLSDKTKLIWVCDTSALTCEDIIFAHILYSSAWQLMFSNIPKQHTDIVTTILHPLLDRISPALKIDAKTIDHHIQKQRKQLKLKPLKEHKKNCVIQ